MIKDEKNLQLSTTYRSSCIFPLFNLDKTDFILLFQNYWKWKRDIDVFFELCIRNEFGTELLKVNKQPNESNYISASVIIKESKIKKKDTLNGTIELSIFSVKNIIFPFPAVYGVYKQKKNKISLVHSAGRTLEKGKLEKAFFNETNFYLSLDEKYDPFIHIFNGPSGDLKNLSVELSIVNSELPLVSKKFSIQSINNPYESKIIFLNKYIKKFLDYLNLEKKISSTINSKFDIIAKLKGESESIYPRFICGNFHLKDQFPSVTHTFRDIVDDKDKITITKTKERSTLALPLIEDLHLTTFIYPSSNPSSAPIELNIYDLDKNQLTDKKFKIDIRSDKGKLFSLKSDRDYFGIKNIGLCATGKEIPTRIHVNLMYSCKSNSNSFPTDISLDFRPYLLKPKFNYWSNGIFIKGYKNYVILSTFMQSIIKDNLNLKDSTELKIEFFLNLNKDKEWKRKLIEFPKNEKTHILNIEELTKDLFYKKEFGHEEYFSWRIKIIDGSIQDVYCIGFNKSEGSIFGDHSF